MAPSPLRWLTAVTRSTTPSRRRPPPVAIRTTERIVAVGDIHGAYRPVRDLLRTAGIIDGRSRWIGGRTVLVQTGDVLDRGADSRRVLDLLRRLETEAARAGGRVHALLGNHEVMRMVGDWRYVSAGEFAAFRDADSGARRDEFYELAAAHAARVAEDAGDRFDERTYRARFLTEVPLGFVEMRQAFDASGTYGRWLRSRDTTVIINDIAFVHGGFTPTTAAKGCTTINETVRRELMNLPATPEALASTLGSSPDGPLWYRGLAEEPEAAFEPQLVATLTALGVRAIVTGHTPSPGRIITRFEGRVIQIDSGMLGGTFYPDGAPSALEIRGDSVTAVYANRREPLRVPHFAPAAAP